MHSSSLVNISQLVKSIGKISVKTTVYLSTNYGMDAIVMTTEEPVDSDPGKFTALDSCVLEYLSYIGATLWGKSSGRDGLCKRIFTYKFTFPIRNTQTSSSKTTQPVADISEESSEEITLMSDLEVQRPNENSKDKGTGAGAKRTLLRDIWYVLKTIVAFFWKVLCNFLYIRNVFTTIAIIVLLLGICLVYFVPSTTEKIMPIVYQVCPQWIKDFLSVKKTNPETISELDALIKNVKDTFKSNVGTADPPVNK